VTIMVSKLSANTVFRLFVHSDDPKLGLGKDIWSVAGGYFAYITMGFGWTGIF